MAMLGPTTETVKVWPPEPPARIAGGAIVAADAPSLADDDRGATTPATKASAAALNMRIDTAMANPTARRRRDRTCAFIPSLGDRNCEES
jgi:hypothetical protein